MEGINGKKIKQGYSISKNVKVFSIQATQCTPIDNSIYRNGKLISTSKLIRECTFDQNGHDCANKVIQKWQKTPKLVLFKTKNKGFGIKTLTKIKKGEFVIEYSGEIRLTEEAEDTPYLLSCSLIVGERIENFENKVDGLRDVDKVYEMIDPLTISDTLAENLIFLSNMKEKNVRKLCQILKPRKVKEEESDDEVDYDEICQEAPEDILEITDDCFRYNKITRGFNNNLVVVDPTNTTSVCRFINHSHRPNLVKTMYNLNEFVSLKKKEKQITLPFTRLALFAGRDIAQGEELTWNYGYDRPDLPVIPCFCSEENCTGNVYV